MASETAEEIFNMIEFFGRYGFNKAHAAAYAVITCQTAYLKAKYPTEYMAALLTVDKDDSDRVALEVADCRRMGIPVRPPNVNYSDSDFAIDQRATRAGTDSQTTQLLPGIRFGLGAIKNVGQGAVQAILQGRRDRPFSNVDDLCRRVDLRQVNRRALESLVRCGALDDLGPRSQLLNAVDRMMAISEKAHHAQEIGQMTMFASSDEQGLSLDHGDATDIPRRKQLAWEKELLGLYVSEHPLQQIAPGLEKDVSAFCGQIDKSLHGQTVIIAGMVSRVRRITTKNDEPMAFAQIEDLQGNVEVVIFPKVYEKTRQLWQPDNIILVRGKVQVRRDDPKVICESAVDYQTWVEDRGEGEKNQEEEKEVESAAPRTIRHRLHITVPRSGKQEEDVRLLGEIHSLLTGHRGQDLFSLYVPRDEGMVQLIFPSDTTQYSPALEAAITELLGDGCLRVETITEP